MYTQVREEESSPLLCGFTFFPVERVKWNNYNKIFNYIFFAVGNIPEPT